MVVKTDSDQAPQEYREQVQEAIAFSGKDLDFFTEAKARCLLNLAEKQGEDLRQLQVLDVGCGVGLIHRFLAPRFGSLYGVDIADNAIEDAVRKHPAVHYQVCDGKVLPFPDDTFHLVFAICVLHHVPPADWEGFVQEMQRVARRGGLVVIFEHNPFNPLTRLVVRRCAFDADAVLLRQSKTRELLKRSGLDRIEQGYLLLFPFPGAFFSRIEHGLRGLPLGAQYFVAGRKAGPN